VQRESDTKEAVAGRLLTYRQGIAGVLPCFRQVLKELDGSVGGDKGIQALVDAALPLITSDMPSRAPRGCPRVLLLGGPGANTEELGAALAQTYGVKHVSAIELLHSAALNGAKKAAAAMGKPDPLFAGDALIGPLVLKRLQMDDVRTCGFVLTGFPRTTMHAAYLAKNGVWLRHAVHLELDQKAALKLCTGRRYDPADGAQYHIDTNMPENEITAAHLVVHPKDEPNMVKMALKTWADSKAGLCNAYAKQLLVEDATRPERQLVERLATCFLGEL